MFVGFDACLACDPIVDDKSYTRGCHLKVVTFCGCLWLVSASAIAEVTFEWADIGNAGNVGELTGAGAGGFGDDAIVGGVNYDFRISKHAVTNAQYAEFLNSVAQTDPNALYDSSMASGALGGITRSGSSGSFTYAAKPGRSNNPVVYVSFFDAMSLCKLVGQWPAER